MGSLRVASGDNSLIACFIIRKVVAEDTVARFLLLGLKGEQRKEEEQREKKGI